MHREVNSGLSITFILVAALAVFIYAQLGLKEIDRSYQTKVTLAKAKSISKDEKKTETEVANSGIACKDRMFEGEAKLKMWRDGEPVDSLDKQVVVRIIKEDLAKLPISLAEEDKENFKAKLVDMTQEIELELNKHSETNPAEVTIKGYKYVCQGLNLISLYPPLESLKNI